MLNETHVEGIVTKSWEFDGARFVRIACHPDPGRTLKRNGSRRSGAEYVTLRFEPPLAMAAARLETGDRVRASGYLASREYDLSLSRFAESARGDEAALQAIRELAAHHGNEVQKPHVLNEVVAERFATL